MTDLARVRIALSGWPGGPGVITEHYSQGSLTGWDATAIEGLVEEVAARYDAQSSAFTTAVTLQVEASVGIFDSATGDLVDVIVSPTTPDPVDADGTNSALSRASQIGVRLLTSDFRNGRRVQGRLFWGPADGSMFDTDGTIKAAERASIAASFAASISGLGPRLAVWSRPSSPSATDGNWADVTTVVVATNPFVLRSRRD